MTIAKPTPTAPALPEKRQSPGFLVRRVMLLKRAQEILGQQALADALGISPRTLRAYFGFDVRLSDATLKRAADAIDAHAAAIAAVANDLRQVAIP